MLKGFIAHELAHGILKHHFRSFYSEKKNERTNEILAGVTSIMVGAASVIDAVNNPSDDKIERREKEERLYNNLVNIQNRKINANIRFAFRYKRMQEFESDIIAYRYLENLGKGEEYINGLRLLGANYDKFYLENDTYEDHPCIQDRIEFLKYLKKKSK